jgi:hypothetical protein
MMPFKSKSQLRACFAKRERGQAKGWNCKEWAHKTRSIKKLPEKKGAAEVIRELEKQASTSSQLLGIRAAALMLGLPLY